MFDNEAVCKKRVLLFIVILGLMAGSLQTTTLRYNVFTNNKTFSLSWSPARKLELALLYPWPEPTQYPLQHTLRPLIKHTFHLFFKDSVIGITWIDATITMAVAEALNQSTEVPDMYMHGFTIYPYSGGEPPLSTSIQGIGVDSIRHYLYGNATLINYSYNEWKDDKPSYIMYRSWPFWTTRGSEGCWSGGASSFAMQGAVTFGQYLFLDGIRLYFENGVEVKCTPNQLLLWVEFHWNGTNWTDSNASIWDSKTKETFLDSSVANLVVVFPVDWTRVSILVMGMVSLTVLLVGWRKRDNVKRLLYRKHDESSPRSIRIQQSSKHVNFTQYN